MDFITGFLANLLGHFDVWLIAIGGVLILRQLFTALAADQGRKQDLVKRSYKSSQDFQISTLIPCLKAEETGELLNLLAAINQQQYPTAKVAVHIVASNETYQALEDLQIQEALAPNVRIWLYPELFARYEVAIGWLIDRCLALGGAGMFVFLKSTDMIKPDFFQNIVSRGFDSFVIQGYVANKTMPETTLEKISALSRRLDNRISNAGRYHLGLSCRLLDTGWAIKQDVLEMIPYHRGVDLDNLEYTLRLNLENFRVAWAPNVVVYSSDHESFSDRVTLSVGAIFNRMRMFLAYAPRLLTRALARFDLTLAESALSIIKPPTVFIGAALLLMALLASIGESQVALNSALNAETLAAVSKNASWPFGRPVVWFALALSLAVVQLCNLAVARSKASDYLVLMFQTPLLYAMGLLMLPFGALQYVSSLLARKKLEAEAYEEQSSHYRYHRRRATRFDENQAPVKPPELMTEKASQARESRQPQSKALKPGENIVFEGMDAFAPSKSLIDELLYESLESSENDQQHDEERQEPGRKAYHDEMEAAQAQNRHSRQSDPASESFWEGMRQAIPKAILPFQKKGFVNPSLESAHRDSLLPRRPQPVLLPREQIKAVLLSNGEHQLDCLLKTKTTFDDEGNELYTLTLEYKSLAFSTATYRILDQAFYELYAKLSGKGLTILTCGSCGYFYNPTADVPGTLRHSGVCLFGKQGKEVNMSMDAVSVLSQPCDYHASLGEREAIVQHWKDSLHKNRMTLV
ncbi:MAG: glycosyltransferase family 2 protein [Vampirovibrionales bacterium]|nr:glycosyltransferase family 2 protein [Vampirovibrionales bacterium]